MKQCKHQQISVNSTIKCEKTHCKMLLNSAFQDLFVLTAQTKFNHYFNDRYTVNTSLLKSNITFLIESDTESIKIAELYPIIPGPWLNPVLLGSLAFIAIMFILSLLSFLHNKGKISGGNVMDDAVWLSLTIYSFQAFDFVSDINLSIEMMNNEQFHTDSVIKTCALSSIAFIVVPFAANLYYAARIKTFISSQNVLATTYFENYSQIFVALVCLCGACYPALVVVSSGVFGLNFLNSGLTTYELRQLNKIKIIGTIFMENVPQLIIQMFYSFTLGVVSDNTYLAFTGSIISVISALLTYFIQKNDDNLMVFNYYIETHTIINNDNDDDDDHDNAQTSRTVAMTGLETTTLKSLSFITEEEKNNFIQNKGKTESLAQDLCEIFNITRKNIEISKQSNITSYGLKQYVIHYLNRDDHNYDIYYIKKLYSIKSEAIDAIFRKHFSIDKSFITEFRMNATDDTDDQTRDGDDSRDDTDNIQNALRHWMEQRKFDYKSAQSREKFFNTYFAYNNNTEQIGENVKHDVEENQQQVEMEPILTCDSASNLIKLQSTERDE